MKNLKFLVLSLLAVLLTFGLVSCSKDKDDNPSTSTENTTGNDDVNNNPIVPVSPTFTFSNNFNEEEKSIEMGEELTLTIANLNADTKVSASLDGEVIEVKNGVINLPTSDLGKYKLNVVINNDTYKFTYNVVPVKLNFESAPTLSKSEVKFGDDLSVNVKTNLVCNVTIKIGDKMISSVDSQGEVSISIPTVVKADEYTATIIVTDGTTTKQSDVNYKIGLPDFVMVKVEGGTFNMGAQKTNPESPNYYSEALDKEGPVHSVTLSSYSIGQTEVTQALWYAVMGENPSYYTEKNADNSINNNSKLPVTSVSWKKIQPFLIELNRLTGKSFRLPTEAEWEFAARGGKKSQGYIYSGSNDIEEVAWYGDNKSSIYVHQVATKKENELGIYDMSGNVLEWCQDLYEQYKLDAQTNPTGAETGIPRVLRGGSCEFDQDYNRVSYRMSFSSDYALNVFGFRLAL